MSRRATERSLSANALNTRSARKLITRGLSPNQLSEWWWGSMVRSGLPETLHLQRQSWAADRHFRTNKAGVILNASSGAGVFTLPMLSFYCASKFALEGFSEALSYELYSKKPCAITSINGATTRAITFLAGRRPSKRREWR